MRQKTFPVLDGLRGIFLLWVMFVHLPAEAVPSALADVHHYWIFGVDGFLAISGFLVTRSLHQCERGVLSASTGRIPVVREFLVRRLARIVPPYYLMLGAILTIALVTRNGLYDNLKASWTGALGFPLFFANYSIPLDHARIPVMLQPYWSISFQEQFYFVLALVYAWLGFGAGLKRFLWISGFGAIALRLALAASIWKGQYRGWEYEANLHLAFDSISWGCLAWLYYDELGVLWRTRLRAWVSSAIILIALAAAIAARSYWHDSASMAVLSIFRAPLLALGVRMACEYQSRQTPLHALGRISYETYLVHPLLYAMLEKVPFVHASRFALIAYPCTWLAGFAFHHAFGRPAQRWLVRSKA